MLGPDVRELMTTRRTLLKYCALVSTVPLAGCLGESEPDDGAGGPADAGGDTTGSPGETDSPTTDSMTEETEETEQSTTDDGLPTDDTTDSAGGTRPAGTGGPGVTLVGTDDRDGPLEHAVDVVESVATEDAPPQLRVTVTNTSDRTVVAGEARSLVFAHQSDTENQLTLLPAGGEYPAEAGCWRLTEPVAVTTEYRMVSLDPGESTDQSLVLYGAPGEDACLPVGEYRFETTYRADATDGETHSTPETEYEWGFTVLME